MKKRLELSTISKISGDIKLGIPQPQQQPQQNICNPHCNIYNVSRPQIHNISIYITVYENPIFLLGLLGFAGVVLRYNGPQGPQERDVKQISLLTELYENRFCVSSDMTIRGENNR
jgi:hypothetical protein